MSIEHHDLVHEFPELRDRIHELKISDRHFRKLFDEYHEMTNKVEHMEDESQPASTSREEAAKIRRLQLKDELYQMLIS